MLFFTVAQLEGHSVKGQCHIGPYDSLVYYLKFSLNARDNK